MSMSLEAIDAMRQVNTTMQKMEEMQTVSMHQEMQMLHLQQRMHRDEQVVATKSSIDKAKHDALMAIIHNMS